MTNTTNDDAFRVSKGAIRRIGLGLLALLVLVALALGVAALLRDRGSSDTLASAIDPNTFQYVYLTNGESYFGKLSAPGGSYYYMRHVYTLTSQGAARSGVPLQHTLVKLTSEIHNPQDLLVISRRQVVYMENLALNGCGAQLLRGAQKCT